MFKVTLKINIAHFIWIVFVFIGKERWKNFCKGNIVAIKLHKAIVNNGTREIKDKEIYCIYPILKYDANMLF